MTEEITWWRFDNAVDSKTCNKIVQLAEKQWKQATTKGERGKDKRKTNIAWTDEQWLFDLVFDYMQSANEQSGWNFEVDAAESMQIGKYSKGCFYDYHADGDGVTVYDKPENNWLHNKTRKLSMTILLNEDYEGGNFEIAYIERGKLKTETVEKSTGTILMFPSNLHHRVKPVTAGTRYSLVAWFAGPPFK